MSADCRGSFLSLTSIHSGKPVTRSRPVDLFYSLPDRIDENTGLLLVISPYGAQASSRMFADLRDARLADLLNVVTVQADYFGHEFMTYSVKRYKPAPIDRNVIARVFSKADLMVVLRNGKVDFERFMQKVEKYPSVSLCLYADLSEETPDNFNDMGLMQAADCIGACLAAVGEVRKRHPSFIPAKTVAWGHSHGAYLAHLCNIMAPGLFSRIIDNSGMLFPLYTDVSRSFKKELGLATVDARFVYSAPKFVKDFDVLDLRKRYPRFENKARIDIFHGASDSLVPKDEKRALFAGVNNAVFNEISAPDGVVFSGTEHGIGTNHLAFLSKILAGDKEHSPFNESGKTSVETPFRAYDFSYGLSEGFSISMTEKDQVIGGS